MTGSMDIDPQLLLDLAAQHDRVGDDTKTWAQPPSDWLARFPDTYGSIAQPVLDALNQYYEARQNAGDALAQGHYDTAAALRAAAAAYEQADQDGARHIGLSGQPFGGPSGPTGPVPPGGPTAPGGLGAPGGSGGAPGTHAGAPGGTTPGGPDGGGPAAQTPGHGGPATSTPDGAGPLTPPAGAGVVPPLSGQFDGPPGPGGGGFGGGGPGVGGFGARISGADADPGAGPAGPGAGPGGVPPILVPTPFAEQVAAAKKKEAEPDYVVNGAADDDLLIARTLLSAVLAAVDESVAGTAWAVSVMRGPAGAGVFITSNEGRGWLPPAVFLPREVSTPWLWDEVLEEEGSPWEGVSDPARVLAEFALAWGPRAQAELSAVASSAPIDAGLRARFADVPMAGLVGPAFGLDLRVFTPDTADRLGLTGTPSALEHVASVPDSAVRTRCTELAADAHAQVVRTVPATSEVATARRLRESILNSIQAGRAVPRTLWDDLRDADDLLAATMLGRRVDVGRVDIGSLRVDDEAGTLRDMVFERRCNELILALSAQEPTRQHLRDAVYAHEQIVDHPQFVPAPVAVTAPTAEQVGRPVPAGAEVSAPAVAAGPPSGATVVPADLPPAAGEATVPEED